MNCGGYMKDCNYSIYLAGQSIDKIDAVNKGYQKAIEEMSKIIHSKDNLDFLDEDDLGNIIFQLCEYFEIKNIDSKLTFSVERKKQ